MSDVELRALIRQRIQSGLLPRGPGDKTFGGPGNGETCDCCDQSIPRHRVRYEVEYARPDASFERLLVAHLECHQIWIEESTRPPGAPAVSAFGSGDVTLRKPHS
jgi:hypothetical protein